MYVTEDFRIVLHYLSRNFAYLRVYMTEIQNTARIDCYTSL